MEIDVVSGVGRGRTKLSAFDAALFDAGVHNYNLVENSSVIPPNVHVNVIERRAERVEEYGWQLHCVYSNVRSDKEGSIIAAGLGWYRTDGGYGLFVEHARYGSLVQNDTEESVRSRLLNDMRSSLEDMCGLRGFSFDETRFRYEMASTIVSDVSACALVLAAYKALAWEDHIQSNTSTL